MIPMADSDGWREAMVGTLSFYDHAGERQHTLYLAAEPEHGKHTFTERLAREIARAKQHYPDARWLGIADGAASNWAFLEQHTERQLIDFFHATEYIAKLARARFPQRTAEDKRAAWQHAYCNRLKRDPGVLDELVAEAARLSRCTACSPQARDDAYSAWTYFNNHRHQMDYPGFLAEHLPIGSGVTEAAARAWSSNACALRHALENPRRQDRAQPEGTDQHRPALGTVLAEDRPVRGRVLRLMTLLRGRTHATLGSGG